MTSVGWVFVVLAVVAVVVVALLAVGGEVFTLSRRARPAVFDLDEAVEHVADNLPFELRARLTYDDVRTLLQWHMEHLRDRGVPADGEDPDAAGTGAVVVADEETSARLYERALESGLEVSRAEVGAVLEAEASYLRAIGAIGPEVEGPTDPQ